jgi:hypothetical protein
MSQGIHSLADYRAGGLSSWSIVGLADYRSVPSISTVYYCSFPTKRA